jgi:hypothetical protein
MRVCDNCGRPLSRGRRRFCCNKCKDRWHNLNNPRGYYAFIGDMPVRQCEVTEWDHGDNGYLGQDGNY